MQCFPFGRTNSLPREYPENWLCLFPQEWPRLAVWVLLFLICLLVVLLILWVLAT
uniref:Uncharacterized protein n=1 Tax=Gopherus agassizii TaxID=38772 RepID=A0A452IXY7_9SAUR